MGTERPRPNHLSGLRLRCDDRTWRDVLLYPRLEDRKEIERVRTGAAAAMMHAGREVEPHEGVGILRAADGARRRIEVVEGAVGADRRVGPAVIHDQLAPVVPERAQVWIEGAEDFAHHAKPREVLRKAQCLPAVLRIVLLEREDSHVLVAEAESAWRRRAEGEHSVRPGDWRRPPCDP